MKCQKFKKVNIPCWICCSKAEVDTLIGKILWEELPESYSDSMIFDYRQKIYEYVYMRYKEVA